MLRRARPALAAAAAFGLLALAPATALAVPSATPTHGKGHVDHSVTRQGKCVYFSGARFQAHARLTITDDAHQAAHTKAGGHGHFDVQLCFSTDARVGKHHLKATGEGRNTAARDVTATVRVKAASDSQTGTSADAYPPPTHGRGEVDRSVVHPGECVHFSGGRFFANARLRVTDDGYRTARTRANQDGNFRVRVCFSSDAHLGKHELKATGKGYNGGPRDVTANVRVKGVSESQQGSNAHGRAGVDKGSGARSVAAVRTIPFTGTEIAAIVMGLLLAVYLGVRLTRWRNHRLWS